MKNKMKLLSFLWLTIFSSAQLKAVVVIHEHHHGGIQTLHLGPTPGSSLAAGLGEGLSALLHNKVQEQANQKKFEQYTGMFLDLGYDRAQAKAYAKLAMDNPGGYAAVLANIERDNELRYKRETEKQLLQQQIRAQQELTKLNHQQKLQQMKYQQQSQNDTYYNMAMVSLIIFLLLGIALFGLLIYHRLGRKK